MTRVSRLAVIAAVTAMIATPAFAQSFDPEADAGNVPSFSTPSSVLNGEFAAHGHSKVAAQRSGQRAFAMVPGAASGIDSNNPALTGGGSAGFNEMLLRD
jgi:hypothetical protein